MDFVKDDIDSLKITLGKMKIQNYVSKSTEKLKKKLMVGAEQLGNLP